MSTVEPLAAILVAGLAMSLIAFVGALVLLWLASGCATVGALAPARETPVAQPELPAEYDVLVGEFATLDGDLEQAREHAARATELDPDSVQAWNNLGYALAASGCAGILGVLELELDDHTAEAGLLTRCEAFLDSLKVRKGAVA